MKINNNNSLFAQIGAKSQMPSSNIQYINSFNNLNHPEIAYWFFNKDMLNEISWKNKIDSGALAINQYNQGLWSAFPATPGPSP